MKTPAIKPSQRIKSRQERNFNRAVMQYKIVALPQTEFPGGMSMKEWLLAGFLGLLAVAGVVGWILK